MDPTTAASPPVTTGRPCSATFADAEGLYVRNEDGKRIHGLPGRRLQPLPRIPSSGGRPGHQGPGRQADPCQLELPDTPDQRDDQHSRRARTGRTERVTDHQYAVLGGHVRHLPGGVDEYFALRQREDATPRQVQKRTEPAEDASGLSPAEHRRITKEVQAVTRKLERIDSEVARLDSTIAKHGRSDFEGLAELSASRNELLEEKDELELQWLELSEQLE